VVEGVTSAPEVIEGNSTQDGHRAVQRFCGSLDETVDDQCEGSKDEGCGQEGIEWSAVLVGDHDVCTTKTKDRGEGQGHKQREYEAAVDEKLFKGSAQNK
jgi:hypothetical protein